MAELGRPDDLLRQAVLSIQNKTGQGCTYEDALVLAKYDGRTPQNNELFLSMRMHPYEGLYEHGRPLRFPCADYGDSPQEKGNPENLP
jgi:hypothetical protein